MPRLTSYTRDDAQPVADGDVSFAGVVDRGEPERVPPGYVSAAQNFTFADGTARTRKGIMLPSCFRAATLVAPLYGAGIFSNPNGLEFVLIAEASRVVKCRDGHSPSDIGIPEAITGRVTIVQGFDEVLLFRGPSLVPWRWSGVDGEDFEPISQEETGDGTTAIPNGPDFATRPGLRPVVVNSRIIVPHGRNGIAVSDIEDYTRYDEAYSDFNLSAANDDTLAGLLPMGQSGLLALKDGSVALITGISSTLSGIALTSVTGAPGCVAGATAVATPGGVLYLAERGVQRIEAANDTRVAADPTLTSAPIERLMRRVNAQHIETACAAVQGEYYFLAVPYADSERPNAIYPLNLRTGAWEGVHTFPSGVAFDELLVTDYQGERRLYGVDFTAARVHLLYEGSHDRVTGSTRVEITQSLTTRGYRFDQVNRKMMRRGKLHVRGWWPVVSATCSTNAVNDSQSAASSFTPDRTKYKTFGVADYVTTNAGTDHATAGREDYSVEPSFQLEQTGYLGAIYQGPYSGTSITVTLDDAAMTPLAVGDKVLIDAGDDNDLQTVTSVSAVTSGRVTYGVTPAKTYADGEDVNFRRDVSAMTGIDFDLEQAHQIPVLMRQVGTSGTITLSNTRGLIALTAIELEGTAAQRTDTRQ
jgi:hypothetical protein